VRRDAAAIIVAAGRGLRFGGRRRKQYVLLKGRPLLRWSVEAFANSPSVGALIVVVPQTDVRRVTRQLASLKTQKYMKVVAGGKTRSESVRRGLKAIPGGLAWVAVHDGVRPLVTSAVIERTFAGARRYGAAIAACRSKDTVKLAQSNGCIKTTPSRESVWLAQTPQIFKRTLLERAHARNANRTVTDDAQLVERLGNRVKLVESPPENLKVTVPSDLEMARLILKAR
jgi:2-C-methyl-D-erythritol 4-phosphate cytidylyltransferase